MNDNVLLSSLQLGNLECYIEYCLVDRDLDEFKRVKILLLTLYGIGLIDYDMKRDLVNYMNVLME